MGLFHFFDRQAGATCWLSEEVLGALLALLEEAPGPRLEVLEQLSERRHAIDGTAPLGPEQVRALAAELARARARFDALGFQPDGAAPPGEVPGSPEARARQDFRRSVDPAAFLAVLEEVRSLVDRAAARGAPLAWSGVS